MNERLLSIDNLKSLSKNWPADEYSDLLQEAADDKKAEWEKAEAFFIALGEKKKFDIRIKIWLFKI